MKIIIMRHGKAVTFSHKDAARTLSEEGIQQAKNQAIYLQQQGIIPHYILVSPYTRTQQTVEYLTQTADFQPSPIIEITADLTPYGDPQVLVDYLYALSTKGIQTILLISHLPLVEELASSLGVNNYIGFSTATLAILDWSGDPNESAKLIEVKHAN
ncbi:phosphohistidine phosphatase SixA [Mergibacter septicus]|uniref:phosphohistidine phosphatase SixA n=1 Tax=Mergibacter septicus TaxID=221402 RepID=UPI001C74ABC8|nr:phosphohistidine phosphatase SixA [Mergibacter septicus]QDJ12914.1 phosphohistidine phosphatase SixA [Mergibacter septicus]